MTAKITLLERVPLNTFCTLGIGGPARYFVEVESSDQLREALLLSHKKGWPCHVIGKGSNSLFDDRGFDGLVILNKINLFEELEEGVFRVGAGYSFSRLGVQTARQGFGGLEFASGIPGTVGGAVFMNAGANGAETCDVLYSVEYLDEEGRSRCYPREELTFSYRHSPFHGRKGAIVAATFALTKREEARSLQLKILDYRIKTQPYSEKSAGCIFRNPSKELGAGALIEQCDLKGVSVGGAEVSVLHGNFIINKKGATAEEMKALITKIKEQVFKQKGIALESEVRVVPYSYGDK